MNRKHLAYVFFAVAFLIALAQFVEFDTWFTLSDIHHETFVVMFGFAGLVLLYLNSRKDVK